MNDIVSRMIDTQLLLFIYLLCGVYLSKRKLIREDNRTALVRLMMDVTMPLMVVDAFNKPMTRDEIVTSFFVMAVAFAGCVVTGLIGLVLWKSQPENMAVQKNNGMLLILMMKIILFLMPKLFSMMAPPTPVP